MVFILSLIIGFCDSPTKSTLPSVVVLCSQLNSPTTPIHLLVISYLYCVVVEPQFSRVQYSYYISDCLTGVKYTLLFWGLLPEHSIEVPMVCSSLQPIPSCTQHYILLCKVPWCYTRKHPFYLVRKISSIKLVDVGENLQVCTFPFSFLKHFIFLLGNCLVISDN